jgi:FKBP-type peptidyl-prolyl cis-trans isomerase FkpA
MKRTVVILLFSAFSFANLKCSKDANSCTPVSPQSEEAAILNYAAANGIVPTRHSSGLFYQILSPGTGATPTASSVVGVTYTGKNTSNFVFDEATTQKDWPLNMLIEGWQIGIPLIKKGGSIILLVPSALAYGCDSPPAIPSNSILIFNINLLDVK